MGKEGAIAFFTGFQIEKGSKLLPLEKTKFIVKVTVDVEGATFDMNKGESLAFTNVCCFEREHSDISPR